MNDTRSNNGDYIVVQVHGLAEFRKGNGRSTLFQYRTDAIPEVGDHIWWAGNEEWPKSYRGIVTSRAWFYGQSTDEDFLILVIKADKMKVRRR